MVLFTLDYRLYVWFPDVCTVRRASNQLTGRVLDEYDQPIIGAVVKVSGTSIGRSTDADGAFTVKDIPANATLEVSYVGYEKQSIPVNREKLCSG